MEGVLKGEIPANARFRQHLDLCLTCRRCEEVCPNDVAYAELAYHMRARMPKPFLRKLLEKSALHIISRPQWLFPLLKLAEETRPLWRRWPVLHRFAEYQPPIAKPAFASFYPGNNPQGEVMFFLGCVARVVDHDTIKSAIALLQKHGFAVHVPLGQSCCGALHRHLGDEASARDLALQNMDAFVGNLPILSVASGCAANLLDYAQFLQTPKAAAFQHRIHDAFAFLAPHLKPLQTSEKLAYHLPCTMQNVLGIDPFVTFFKGISPLAGNDQCCGGAGSYMIAEPKMADLLLQDKIESIRQSGADTVLTANIGCMLHLQKGVRRAGLPTKILHPLVFLA